MGDRLFELLQEPGAVKFLMNGRRQVHWGFPREGFKSPTKLRIQPGFLEAVSRLNKLLLLLLLGYGATHHRESTWESGERKEIRTGHEDEKSKKHSLRFEPLAESLAREELGAQKTSLGGLRREKRKKREERERRNGIGMKGKRSKEQEEARAKKGMKAGN